MASTIARFDGWEFTPTMKLPSILRTSAGSSFKYENEV